MKNLRTRIRQYLTKYATEIAVVAFLILLIAMGGCGVLPSFLGGGGGGASEVPAVPKEPETIVSEGIRLAKTTLWAIVILAVLLPSPIERLLNILVDRFRKKK